MSIPNMLNIMKDTAQAVSVALETHKNSEVLLLLAGGSALDVLEYVDTSSINEYTTIMMMDERFSSKPDENNYLQMSKSSFFEKITKNEAYTIPTVPEEGETLESFAEILNNTLHTYFSEHPNATVLALFGIGADGHTAGIFPMKNVDFVDTYGQGELYVPGHTAPAPFTQRSSITPKCIMQHVTTAFVYAVGAEKTAILQTLHDPYELHELPAYIHTQIESKIFTDLPLQREQTST